MPSPIAIPRIRFNDASGNPLAFGWLTTYRAGTTTLEPTFTDAAGAVPNTNPIHLDADGEAVIFLGDTYAYDFKLQDTLLVLQPVPGLSVQSMARVVNTGSAAVLARLASTSLVTDGDALSGVYRDDLTGAVPTNQHEVNKALPVLLQAFAGLVLGAGISGAARTANGVAINAAIQAAKTINSKVILPAGRIEYDGTLIGANGVLVDGFGNMGEQTGGAFAGTTLAYYGNTYAVDLMGTSVSVSTRIQCKWSNFTLDCSGGGVASQGIRLGWNQRSMNLLDHVTIKGSGHYGINWAEQVWNIGVNCVRVDGCGTRTAGSCGVYKAPAVDSGTWNALNFHNLQVESCGTATSAAGGIDMQTTTANRGVSFSGTTIIEGNFGVCEVLISNMAGLSFDHLYMERTLLATQTTGIKLVNCEGNIKGGYLAVEALAYTGTSYTNGLAVITGISDTSRLVVGMLVEGPDIPAGTTILSIQAGIGLTLTANVTATHAANAELRVALTTTIALQATTGSDLSIDGVSFGRWGLAQINNQGSVIRTGHNGGLQSAFCTSDASAQWLGEIFPSFIANKGAADQVLADATDTNITFGTEESDELGFFASPQWTPHSIRPVYLSGVIRFTAPMVDGAVILLQLYRNGGVGVGTLVRSITRIGNGAAAQSFDFDFTVQNPAVGTTWQLVVKQTSGGALTISGATNDSWMTGEVVQ